LNPAWLWLSAAIASEVVATSFMRQTEGFTRLLPSLVTAGGYAIAFWCLSHALRTIPTGVAYAVWSGVGIVAIAAIAWVFQGQRLDAAALIGMALIVAGVAVMNLFSHASAH
jgi:small multidrug resistance pump